METLYKLTAAGLPLFDINTEYLDRTNWCVDTTPNCDATHPSSHLHDCSDRNMDFECSILTKEQVTNTSRSSRFLASLPRVSRQLVPPSDSPPRRHILGRRSRYSAQCGLGQSN